MASAGDESFKFLTYRASISRGLVEHAQKGKLAGNRTMP